MPVGFGSGATNDTAFGSILSAIPVVGGILNGVTQMFTNSSNRRFQREMYERQRADALADWNMQNQYNLPSSQMQRLKDAGLNPNLVYGSGNAVATSGGMPRGSTPSGTSGQAPKFDVTGMFPMLMFQLKEQMQAQQIENLKTQNIVLQTQAGKNIATTENTQVDTSLKQVKFYVDDALKETNIASGEARLRSLNTQIYNSIQSNERANLLNSVTIEKALQSIVNMKEQVIMMKMQELKLGVDTTGSGLRNMNYQQQYNLLDQQLQKAREETTLIMKNQVFRDLEIQWKRAGISERDQMILRVLYTHGEKLKP